MQQATKHAVEAITGITSTILRMKEIASAITAAVRQQGAATEEIARSVQQAAVGTEEVSSNMNQVRDAANDTGHAAEQVLTSATQVAQRCRRDGSLRCAQLRPVYFGAALRDLGNADFSRQSNRLTISASCWVVYRPKTSPSQSRTTPHVARHAVGTF
jgi:hypothetical protein